MGLVRGRHVTVPVVVVDSFGYLAEGIRRHLKLVQDQGEKLAEMRVESVSTMEEAIRVGRTVRPALVFMDLSLPQESSGVFIRRLRTELPESKVIACSLYDHGWLVARTLAAGAHGYIAKSSGHEEFWRVVRTVLDGRVGVPDSVQTRWRLELSRQAVTAEVVRRQGVSVDDVQVILRIVQGATAAELAEQWGCATDEVAPRRAALQARLGCRTAEEWCRLALASGLMPDAWGSSHRSGSA